MALGDSMPEVEGLFSGVDHALRESDWCRHHHPLETIEGIVVSPPFGAPCMLADKRAFSTSLFSFSSSTSFRSRDVFLCRDLFKL